MTFEIRHPGLIRLLLAVALATAGACVLAARAAAVVGCSSTQLDCDPLYGFGAETFTVPDGVTSLTIDAVGAPGGANNNNTQDQGSFGGEATGTFSVTPGETLEVVAGGSGGQSEGGVNGGGGSNGFGGGGDTDVRSGACAVSANCPFSDAIVVGGGGGGQSSSGASGGAGGNPGAQGSPSGTGQDGQGGFGGSQSGPGNGGQGGVVTVQYPSGSAGGTQGGGAGGSQGCQGGGGGGGYHGGGGGGSSVTGKNCGGGGGGGSYVASSASNVSYSSGVEAVDGYANELGEVTFTWCCGTDTYGQPATDQDDNNPITGEISPNTTVYDTAYAYDSWNDNAPPGGAISFAVCGPASSAQACSSGGQALGSPTVDQYGYAASSGFTPSSGGWYCFRADYSGSGSWSASSDSSTGDQCFEVSGPVIVASQTTESVSQSSFALGGSVQDNVTVASNPSGGATPTGTVTFGLCTNATTGCTSWTNNILESLSGGQASTPLITPTSPGNYCFGAVYGGATPYSGSQDEGTDGCFTVTPATPQVSSGVLDGNGNAFSNEVTGATAVGTATVTGNGSQTPGGFLLYSFYDNGSCNGSPTSSDQVSLSNGLVPNSPATGALGAGTDSVEAYYEGDANYNVASSCTQFSVGKASAGFQSTLQEGGGSAWTGSEVTGQETQDASVVSGNAGIAPTGTVRFFLTRGDTCSGAVLSSPTEPIVNGTAASPESSPLPAGTYSYDAFYGGDGNYEDQPECQAFSVGQATPSVGVTVDDAGTGNPWAGTEVWGASAEATGAVSGNGGIVPTGTVDYSVYNAGDCQSGSGTVIFSQSGVGLDGSGDSNLSQATAGLPAGSYSFEASYDGDGNYLDASGCSNFSVGTPPAPSLQSGLGVSGNAHDGWKLTASPGSWSSPETLSYSYEWERCSRTGDGCNTIQGADQATYYSTSSDVGHELTVQVTATDQQSQQTSESATPVGPIGGPSAPASQTLPVISGNAVDGQVVKTNAGAWRSPDKLSYRYDWQRCDPSGNGCGDISNATNYNYKLTGNDVGHQVRVVVTAIDHEGDVTPADATPVGPVAGPSSPPSEFSGPAISGGTTDGDVVKTTNGKWGSPDTLTYTYEWERCDSSGNGCTGIGGATAHNYRLTGLDAGHQVTVVVTAHDQESNTNSATAIPVGPVAESPAPVVQTHPWIVGTAQRNAYLVAEHGTWQSTDHLTFTYLWEQCSPTGDGCNPITNATADHYRPAVGDVGHELTVLVVAHDQQGQSSQQVMATPIGPIAAPAPPSDATAPTIEGNTVQGGDLIAEHGRWNSPDVLTYSYEWQRCNAIGTGCTKIDGATRSNYKPTLLDVGHELTVVIAATDQENQTGQSATAAPVGPVTPAVPF